MENKEEKQIVYSEKILTVIDKEYERKREDNQGMDNKIIQFSIIQSTLLILFIKLISFPKNNPYGIVLYSIIILSIMFSLCSLFFTYIPKSYTVIDPIGINKKYNLKGIKEYKLFLEKLPNGINKTYEELEKTLVKKNKWIKISFISFIIDLILIIIMNIIEQIR